MFNDAERSGIMKDETILHQNLHLFLQHHQDIFVRNIIFSQDPKEGKKIIDFNTLSTLYYQIYNTPDTSVEKNLSKKRRISSRELLQDVISRSKIQKEEFERKNPQMHSYAFEDLKKS